MTDPAEGPWRAVLIALAAGAALWIVGCALAGWHEAWDGPLYFPWIYLAALVATGLIARRHPMYPVRIGCCVFGGQLLVLYVQNPTGNLLPLGVVLFVGLALPAVVVAKLVAKRVLAG